MEILLSIAVGSQLADVFLHLLPEAFSHPNASAIQIGLWILIGLFLFFLIEQIFPDDQNDQSNPKIKVKSNLFNLFQIEKKIFFFNNLDKWLFKFISEFY